MKVAVVGTGYVGLVTAVALAKIGHEVIGVDNDPGKLLQLRSGISPIHEPGIEELLAESLASGKLHFSNSVVRAVRESEIVFIAVGTPPGADGSPDLTAVKEVAGAIATGINTYTIVVNKSTVPVGTGDLVADILLDRGVPRTLFEIVSNPEFLREGSAIKDTFEADRIVIGTGSSGAAAKMQELYAPLKRPVLLTDVRSAELIKYASNSFLAMKISFINAISHICELAGADVGAVAKGVGADNRIGSGFLNAGLGWGGSCFPKDVQGLMKVSEALGYEFELLRAVVQINEDQTTQFVDRLERRLGGFAGKRIAMLGLAFKPNTDDIRDAKSLDIIDRIIRGGGTVVAYDPVAWENVQAVCPQVEIASDAGEVFNGADAVLLVTEWEEFRHLNYAGLRNRVNQPIFFDGRRMLADEPMDLCGWEYHTVGTKSRSVAVTAASVAA